MRDETIKVIKIMKNFTILFTVESQFLGDCLFPAAMLKFALSSTSLNFFLKLSSNNLPIERDTQLWRPTRKTTSCKKASESPSWFSSLIGHKNIFLANQKQGIQMLLELVR